MKLNHNFQVTKFLHKTELSLKYIIRHWPRQGGSGWIAGLSISSAQGSRHLGSEPADWALCFWLYASQIDKERVNILETILQLKPQKGNLQQFKSTSAYFCCWILFQKYYFTILKGSHKGEEREREHELTHPTVSSPNEARSQELHHGLLCEALTGPYLSPSSMAF